MYSGMAHRILIFVTLVLSIFSIVSLASAKTPAVDECPFSYVLPEEIKPLLNLSLKDLQKHPVIWSVKCRQLLPFERLHPMSSCRIDPAPPHRRICSTTSRWNNRDSIMIMEIKKGWTDIIYSAEGPNDYRLIIRPIIKPDADDVLVAETRQKILKISTSVHVKNVTPPLPVVTKKDPVPLPDLFAVKKDVDCPFDFKLPKSYVAKIKRLRRSLIYSGHLDSATWVVLCSNDPDSHTHLKHLLVGSNCDIETTPPHYKICRRSKRWDGSEQLVLQRIGWQTSINYQTYTSQDKWMLLSVTFDRHADQSVIERTLEIIQAIAVSVKPDPQ